MNGTPQPNQKRLLALGIKPGSLDHESQPLTIGPLLTQFYVTVVAYSPFQRSGSPMSLINGAPNVSGMSSP